MALTGCLSPHGPGQHLLLASQFLSLLSGNLLPLLNADTLVV